MYRRTVIGFGPSELKLSTNPADPMPLRIGLKDWVGDISFRSLRRQLKDLGLKPSELGLDLFTIALGVYGADLCNNRSSIGDDGWTRHLEVEVEVSDPEFWRATIEPLAAGLRFLSNDIWTFCFRRRTFSVQQLGFESARAPRFSFERVSLFSGGLDSTIGAIDLSAIAAPLILASTSGDSATSGPQGRIYTHIAAASSNPVVRLHQHVGMPSTLRQYPERTQRARSFMFIAFGILVASGIGSSSELILPENGFIALNVPIDSTRLASNSTKTTHPYFISRIREFIERVALNIRLVEPYKFATKGEMMEQAIDQKLLANVLPLSVSCAKAAQLFHQGTSLRHCGACTACIIRRAAILRGYPESDPTGYLFIPDLYAGPIDAKKHGQDIRALKSAAARLMAKPSLASIDVYRSGSMKDVRDSISSYAGVYLRGMDELNDLLKNVETVHV